MAFVPANAHELADIAGEVGADVLSREPWCLSASLLPHGTTRKNTPFREADTSLSAQVGTS